MEEADKVWVAKYFVGVFGIILLLLLANAGAEWYKADVQRGVYERQGVHMSTWEVFMGAKPVERYVVEGK